MSASSNHKEAGKGGPAGVYKALEHADYDDGQAQEKALPIQHSTPSISPNQPQTGAAPIRWGWWTVGLGVSAVVWAGIALAFAAL